MRPTSKHSASSGHAPDPRPAAFFDLDKTVIAASSALAFGRHFYASGLINRRAMLKSAYAQFVYLVGGADEDQMTRMRDELAAMVTGWNVGQVRGIVDEALHELINPLIYDEAAELIESHHVAGRDVVIVSSSGEDVVEPIARMLGAEHVVATRLATVDGHYTGEVTFFAAGPAKAEAMRAMAQRHHYDLSASYAYSDSASDLPMLEAVGHPYAVNPDRGLRKEAAAREWPILQFRHPVPLRARIGQLPPPGHPVTIGVAGAGAVAVLLVVRRRLRNARSSKDHSFRV